MKRTEPEQFLFITSDHITSLLHDMHWLVMPSGFSCSCVCVSSSINVRTVLSRLI